MRLWGGRFAADSDEQVAAFGRSIEVDAEMALDDLDGSVAHVRGLGPGIELFRIGVAVRKVEPSEDPILRSIAKL